MAKERRTVKPIARRALLVFAVAALALMAAGCLMQAADPVTPGQQLTAEPVGATESAPSDVRVISYGQEVNIAEYVVRGKTTIFDFYSDGCPPCRALAPRLERLAESREDIALVVVDINRPGRRGIDWQSPVARQYGLHSIPHLRVFDANGNEQARGDQAYRLVQGWLG
jgi:thioredoxin 1